MDVLLSAIAAFAASIFLHVALWRVRLPARQTRALLTILLITPVVALHLIGRYAPWAPAHPAGYMQAYLFCLALGLAYTVSYSAMEADSPTLVMVLMIAGAGSEGLEAGRLEAEMTDERLLKPRVFDLVRDGLASKEGERFVITAKGRMFVGIFAAYRALMGAPLKGG